MNWFRQRFLPIAAVVIAMPTLMSGGNPAGVSPDEDDFGFWDPDYSTTTIVAVRADTSARLVSFNEVCLLPDEAPPAVVNPIMGAAVVRDAEQMARFVRRINADFPTEIAEAYLTVGDRYGVRGDVAFCQAIIETGWFRFADGTAVTPEQHNYCGMGVTSRGMRGDSFDSVEQGVMAQMQHLYAYCCKNPLPDGEPIIDPRFRLVCRGVAPNWDDLSNRWAMNPNYGRQIMTLYDQLLNFK